MGKKVKKESETPHKETVRVSGTEGLLIFSPLVQISKTCLRSIYRYTITTETDAYDLKIYCASDTSSALKRLLPVPDIV